MHKLSKLVRKLARKKYADEFGPNCWNATLIFHAVTEEVVQIEEDYMQIWLRENTRSLRENELPRWGDVIVYGDLQDKRHKTLDYDKRFNLEHTCVYLTKTRVWNKTGCDESFPWEIISKKEVDRVYGPCALGNPRYGEYFTSPRRTTHEEYRRVIK